MDLTGWLVGWLAAWQLEGCWLLSLGGWQQGRLLRAVARTEGEVGGRGGI